MREHTPLNIALIGMGTVGCGVFNMLKQNADEIRRRTGRTIQVTAVCARDAKKKRPVDLGDVVFYTDPMQAIEDEAVDIVVELIGGSTTAKELIEHTIVKGKHIVTANKAVIAMHGNQLFEYARDNGVILAYEAAVAGGIPIIKVLCEGLSGNRIERIVGIVNGTTNYILSEISEKQRSFNDALSDAQRLGYAEADPTYDVDGIDAAHKLTILASIAFGIPLQFEKVYTEGAADVDVQDVIYAEELGYRIKHLATAKHTDKGIELRVHPTLIPKKSLLADVNGAMNAVMVDGNAVGPTLYYGAGAGASQTASAVLADLIDVARMVNVDPHDRLPSLGFHPDHFLDTAVLDIEEVVSAYYLRLQVKDSPGVLASITQELSRCKISVEAVLQKEAMGGSDSVPLMLLIHPVKEKDICKAIKRIEQLDTVVDKIVRWRLEHL